MILTAVIILLAAVAVAPEPREPYVEPPPLPILREPRRGGAL